MNAVQTTNAIELALINGDVSKLTSEQRISFYNKVCESVGLNPLTQPLAFLKMQGKEILYAKKDATDQLRKLHGVSILKLETQMVSDICVVTATARDKNGKEDSEIGAVDTKGLAGEKLANAMMKASTKAKRRVTLSICGLGILDESEVDSIPGAAKSDPLPASGNVVNLPKPLESPATEAFADRVDTDPGAYVLTVGKYRDYRIDAIGPHDLNRWFSYWIKEKEAGNPDIHPGVLEALPFAEAFLNSRDPRNTK